LPPGGGGRARALTHGWNKHAPLLQRLARAADSGRRHANQTRLRIPLPTPSTHSALEKLAPRQVKGAGEAGMAWEYGGLGLSRHLPP
jgi:hypothetical protein